MLFDRKNNESDNINIPIISASGGLVYIIVAGPISVKSENRIDCKVLNPMLIQNLYNKKAVHIHRNATKILSKIKLKPKISITVSI